MGAETTCRILLVEDEPVITALLQELLQDAGFEVVAVSTGADALAAQLQTPAEVAIVDYGLPDINGLEVCQRVGPALDGNRPRTILATGWGMLEPSQLAGVVDLLLEKPYNMRELLRSVEQLAAER